MKSKVLNSLIYLYYPIVFLFYLGSVFFPDLFMPGFLSGILIVSIFLLTDKFGIKISNWIVISYFLYNVILALIPIFRGFPIDVGIREFSNSGLPILFYFIGSQKKFNIEKFFVSFLIFALLIYSIGLYFHIFLPNIYIIYLERTIYNFHLETYLINRRFNSLIGSISVGLISALAMYISYYFYIKKSELKYIIMYFLSILISIITYQRASYLLVFIIFIITQVHFISNKKYRKFILVELLLSPVILILVSDFIDLENIYNRFLAITTGIDERSNQWTYLSTLNLELIFGNGLGTMSHKALDFSDFLINDGGYFKLLGESGIVGTLLFTAILIRTVHQFYFRKNKSYLDNVLLFIIVIYLIHMIIGNTIFYMILAPIFWIIIGYLNRKEIYNENNRIISTTIS